MIGNNLALTERDRNILAEVTRYGVISRSQLMRLKVFTSKTRANERLRRLSSAGYLTPRVQPLTAGGPRLLYLPGPQLTAHQETKRLINCSELFLNHQLGLVDARIAFEQIGRVTRWLTPSDLKSLTGPLLPDAFIEYVVAGLTYCAFIEYDRGTETIGRFERKVRTYLELAYSGQFEKAFRRRYFRVFVITDSPRRLQSLSDAIATVTDRVFWFTTLRELNSKGPLASIWRRPGGTNSSSLTVA